MKFSIIIPTYNEEHDIIETLEALLRLDYPDKEIMVVDDSTDRTPDIVRRYADRGVRLIHPGGGGRCEARNIGIREAAGEIVIILNADVHPRPDFLRRLAPHYEQGADYVLVMAKVSNLDDLFARYIGCVSDASYESPDYDWMNWTEGFSCRKDIALAAGLFPTGFPVPICAGEDGFFGEGLKKAGARKVVDLSIVVDHVAPGSWGGYWYSRKERGAGAPQVHRYLDKWPFSKIVIWNLLKTLRSAVYLITLAPALLLCARAARHSPRGMADLLPFLGAWIIERAGFHLGEWRATLQIMQKEKALMQKR
ncbi:MAG: glycosyltransferase [Syntrophobacterales bacterium]|jgi:glycosyltransferase involved in cell wall biosynthesis|nr:glycosyltransferase [Syntrophobacterales bacterium]